MDLSSLKLSNSQITKVTKDRIFSLAVAPVTDKVLVLAGDKWGKVGLWDIVSELSISVCMCMCASPHAPANVHARVRVCVCVGVSSP